jgi:conserved hypothetical protein
VKTILKALFHKSTSFLEKLILPIALITVVLFAILFALHREYDLAHPFDEDLFGNYGDFIGGLLSVVSIYLLVETLKEQRATSKEQRDFTEKQQVLIEKQQVLIEKQQKNADGQQINSLFFDLLKHLQRDVSDLNITTEDGRYTNKDFFEELQKKLQDSFPSTIPHTEAVKQALTKYFELYAEHPRLGSYFRILYRICEVIDHSTLDGPEKAKYIKILRAQLTNSELLLLRYNAQTPHGKNFKHYINEYNLLKHLPIFELLEFKRWWGDLKDKPVDRLRISVFCDELKHEIKKLLEDSKQKGDLRGGGWKCCIIKHSDISLEIKIDKATSPGRHHLFDTFGKEEQEKLLERILLDIFSYSNFGRKRKGKDLKIESKSEDNSICSSVTAKDGRPLYRSFQRLSEL